jgi:aldose sugar dehydrogenase
MTDVRPSLNTARRAALMLAASLTALAATTGSPLARAADGLHAVTVARGLVNPWSLAFLPDGRMLVTERPGRLRLIDADGHLSPPVAGLPPVAASGQCGLLDVLPDADFGGNQRLYWSYAEPGEGGNSTAVARGRLVGDRLTEVQVLFRQLPKVASGQHCGGRLVFGRDGRLFLTLGDRFSRKDDAQNPANHLGKIVRIEADGRVPADNPFVGPLPADHALAGHADIRPEIWSLGHRNVQGAALHPDSGELWAVEHGPQGGDEVNVVEAGRNYGWPLLTFGRNYGTGTRIGEEGPKPGFEQPLKVWLPVSIAPSGMAFLTSDRYPGWKGNLFIGALRGEALVRLTLDGRRVVGEQRLLGDLRARIRDVRQGPDGWLYVLTDNADGRVIRLERR